tara:strand:- start:216 stop:764 length:549 start_codon:yes stop_codon:yes gene_type:complete
MSQASIQILSSNIIGEEPFIGDLDEGELLVNNADGRIWAGDSIGSPIELGGSVKNNPMGPLRFSNFIRVDVSNPDNLPISNTNPLQIPEGYYREMRILITFPQNPVSNVVYFDYPIDWGAKDSWLIKSSGITWGQGIATVDEDADNPIDAYRAQGRQIMMELSSFGPTNSWMGRLLWINSIS